MHLFSSTNSAVERVLRCRSSIPLDWLRCLLRALGAEVFKPALALFYSIAYKVVVQIQTYTVQLLRVLPFRPPCYKRAALGRGVLEKATVISLGGMPLHGLLFALGLGSKLI